MARPVNIRREDIIAAARPMFFEKGIAATEMKDIADACGIGRSSLYRYYESKESLALEVAGESLALLMDALDEAVPEGGTGYAAVEAGLSAFVRALKDNVHAVRFLDDFDSYFSDGYPPSPAAADYQGQVRFKPGALGQALRRGVADGSLAPIGDVAFCERLLTNALLGVAQRVLPRAGILRGEQGYAEEYLDETLETLLYRLKC